ncbi:nucleotidyltransferase [Candidatus Micrarchaeota archaeon]|nr:nucleotidyltransferase [Candidatus Micrarchaeota archaeon]
MEFTAKKGTIFFQKELSALDKLVLEFAGTLKAAKIDYVIISGYVAILFGRSRETEDVDLFVEEMPLEKFLAFWNALYEAGFECINESNPSDAYGDYLKEKLAPRFAPKGKIIPNFEVKFPKTAYNNYALKNKVKVALNQQEINISEIELQIAFKLKLGSEKDFEDARHLYNVFKDSLDTRLLENQVKALGVEKQAERILWRKKALS